MKIELPKLPNTTDIEAAIRERRGELAELREMLRLSRVRELRKAAGLGPMSRDQSKRKAATR